MDVVLYHYKGILYFNAQKRNKVILGKILINNESIAFELNGKAVFPFYDLLGNVSALFSSKGTILESYRYSAYGQEEIFDENNNKIDKSILHNPWRYAGKSKDEETNLVFFGYRYYDTSICRWISKDPLEGTDGLNDYVYVKNNPLKYIDPLGLSCESNYFVAENFEEYFYHGRHENKERAGELSIFLNGTAYSRFEGALQMIGGGIEMSIGGMVTYGSCGLAAPLGFYIMAHGADHVIAGGYTVFTGQHQETVTSQLLQTTGLSRESANFIDEAEGVLLTIGGEGIIQVGRNLSWKASEKVFQEINIEVQGISKESISKRFAPDPRATGPHTVFRRNSNGTISHYETYQPQTNPFDPKPWESVKRFDGYESDPHYNKVLQKRIYAPHVHAPSYPGGVRSAESWEIPL